ncbi:MAG: hypothetical protein ACFE95_02635 [Candidatus Hodarchaeota archaeon]
MVERYLDIIVEIKGKGAVTEVRNVKNELNKAKTSAQRFGSSVKNAEDHIARFRITTGGLRREIGAIRNELLVLAFAFGGVVKAVSGSLNAFKQYQSSLAGLVTVGGKLGISHDEVTQAALSLAKDGLMSVSEAAESLKNLLATKNYTLKQSIEIMNAFRDAAAYNRQGTLEFGEAIVRGTQGLKNMLCLSKDTKLLIVSKRGTKKNKIKGTKKKKYRLISIEDIYNQRIFPEVVTYDPSSGNVVTRKVYGIAKNGYRTTLKVKFDDGSSVVCTPNHRFFDSFGNMVFANELFEGDSLLCLTNEFVQPVERTQDITNVVPSNVPENTKDKSSQWNGNAKTVGKRNCDFPTKQKGNIVLQNAGRKEERITSFSNANIVEKTFWFPPQLPKQNGSVPTIAMRCGDLKISEGRNITDIYMETLYDLMEWKKLNTCLIKHGKDVLEKMPKTNANVADAQRILGHIISNLGHSIQNYDLTNLMENYCAQNAMKLKMKNLGKRFREAKLWRESSFGEKQIPTQKSLSMVIINTSRLLSSSLRNLKKNWDTSQHLEKSVITNQRCIKHSNYIMKEPYQSMKEWAGSLYSDLVHLFPNKMVNEILSNLKNAGLDKESAKKYVDSFLSNDANKDNSICVNEKGVIYEKISNKHLNALGWLQFARQDIVRDDPNGEIIVEGSTTVKKITSIEDIGYQDVYDIEVCDLHSFLINGNLLSTNSILVDNVGITQNLSVMEKKYATEMGKTVGTLTEAERRQAHYAGIMREAAIFAGDAAKVASNYRGELSQLNAITFQLKATMGDLFSKGLKPIISALKSQFKAIRDNIEANKELLSVKVSDYFRDFYSYTTKATKGVLGFVKTLWNLRELIKAGVGILILNKVLQMSYGVVGKAIELWKSYATRMMEVKTAEAALANQMIMSKVMMESNTVQIIKNKAALDAMRTSLITAKAALLGISVAIVGVVWALRRLATAEERARKKAVESLATQIDRQRADLELVKSKSRVTEAQRKELEGLEKSGKLTNELKIKLDELRKTYKSLWEEIDTREIELLNLEFRKAKTAADEGLNSLKAYFKTIEDAADPTKLTVEQLTSLLNILEKQRKEAAEGPAREIAMRYRPGGTFQEQLKPRPTDIGRWAPNDQEIQRLIELEKVLIRIKEKKLGLQDILAPDPEKSAVDKDLSKRINNIKNKIREATDKMKSEILKSYGEEQAAAHVAMLNQVEDRKLLAAQAKALGVDTAKFMKLTYEWQAAQYNEIFKKQIEEEQKLRLEDLKRQKEAAEEARRIRHEESEAIINATERVFLLKAGYREKERIQVIDDANQRIEELAKIYIRSAEREVEKRKQIAQLIMDIETWKFNELEKINKQWAITSVNVLMQGAQEAAYQIGYIWFQNERETQNEIRRIRQEFSTKRITDETEVLKRIEIAEKNSAIRTANAWKQVFGVMTSTIINSIQSAFMVQAQQALTFAQSLKWSLMGGVVGIVGTLFTAWNQSRMREEEQFMGMATSLEEQRRTSFGRIASAPVQNISIVPTVNIQGETIFISGGDVSELETGLESMIKSTIQRSLDTGELNLTNVATG